MTQARARKREAKLQVEPNQTLLCVFPWAHFFTPTWRHFINRNYIGQETHETSNKTPVWDQEAASQPTMWPWVQVAYPIRGSFSIGINLHQLLRFLVAKKKKKPREPMPSSTPFRVKPSKVLVHKRNRTDALTTLKPFPVLTASVHLTMSLS